MASDDALSERILGLMRQNPTITLLGITDALSDSTEDRVRHEVRRLRALGVVRRTGSARSGVWHVDLPEAEEQQVSGQEATPASDVKSA